MSEAHLFKFKICLVGDLAVGKTCLIRRYVFNEYSDSYICTIGTKVTTKKITIQHPKTKKPVDVQLYIWDIMGKQDFRKLLQKAYFLGVQGIVAVCDNTREKTLPGLDGWIDGVQSGDDEIPTVFLGNKSDLLDFQEIGLNEIKSFAAGYESPGAYLSSAKTGLNVNFAFDILSKKILKEML
ncbi:MAG: GTP-binding protein [Thermoplasmata archaeon]|nr:MAG: GTP-binding protein [Thermoplasmata archaeon]